MVKRKLVAISGPNMQDTVKYANDWLSEYARNPSSVPAHLPRTVSAYYDPQMDDHVIIIETIE